MSAPGTEEPFPQPGPPQPEPQHQPHDRPLPSPGRAFAVYSALRIALLVASYAVLRVLLGGENELLVVGAAVLLSALLSLVLLRRQRDAFTSASIARADARRAAKQARRARLEDDGRTGPEQTGA